MHFNTRHFREILRAKEALQDDKGESIREQTLAGCLLVSSRSGYECLILSTEIEEIPQNSHERRN